MRAEKSGINDKEEHHTGGRAEAISQPVQRIGAGAVRGEKLVEFVEGAVNGKRGDGDAGHFSRRPGNAPAQRQSQRDAAGGEGDEMRGFIPKLQADLRDLGTGE